MIATNRTIGGANAIPVLTLVCPAPGRADWRDSDVTEVIARSRGRR
jgi:hypothetical protein